MALSSHPIVYTTSLASGVSRILSRGRPGGSRGTKGAKWGGGQGGVKGGQAWSSISLPCYHVVASQVRHIYEQNQTFQPKGAIVASCLFHLNLKSSCDSGDSGDSGDSDDSDDSGDSDDGDDSGDSGDSGDMASLLG